MFAYLVLLTYLVWLTALLSVVTVIRTNVYLVSDVISNLANPGTPVSKIVIHGMAVRTGALATASGGSQQVHDVRRRN